LQSIFLTNIYSPLSNFLLFYSFLILRVTLVILVCVFRIFFSHFFVGVFFFVCQLVLISTFLSGDLVLVNLQSGKKDGGFGGLLFKEKKK